MAADPTVEIDRHDHVAVVTISAPATRNALTPSTADTLVEALRVIDADQSVGAIVIKGANATFCSGADLSSLGAALEDPASEESYDALERIYRAFTRLGETAIPTVAAVRGAAVGAGVNLMLAADVRIVSEEARIISGFTRLGLHPGGGHLQLVTEAANREVACAMAILGIEVKGSRAAELGLAWEAVADAEVEDRAFGVAARAAADPVLARRVTQSLRITNPRSVPWAAALQAERAPQLWSLRRKALADQAANVRSHP